MKPISGETAPPFETSHNSGRYSKDLIIVLTPKNPDVSLFYRFTNTDEKKEGYGIEYTVPLHLSALPGATEEYHLSVTAVSDKQKPFTQEFHYLIDKSIPSPPTISLPPGMYQTDCNITFSAQRNEQIIYSVNTPVLENGIIWDGKQITLHSEGTEPKVYTVSAYSSDDFGMKSRIYSWTYIIKKPTDSQQRPKRPVVVSPVPGTFSNPQFLYIKDNNCEWIRYTVNADDPSTKGVSYRYPHTLDFTGTVKLKIAAKMKGSEKIFQSEIEYTVVEEPALFPISAVSLKNGVYDKSVDLAINEHLIANDPLYFTLQDRPVKKYDTLYTNPLTLLPLKDGVKYYTLRLSTEKMIENDNSEYRFFLLFDDRKPLPPVIYLHDSLPLKENTMVTIVSSDTNTLYYTTDGTSPDRASKRYSGPFMLELPQNAEAGSLTIRSRAYSPGGAISQQVTKLVTFDKSPPDKPRVLTPLHINSNKDVTIELSTDEHTSLLYEISSKKKDVSEPSSASPRCDKNVTLMVPYGMEKIFVLRFAAIDNAGNISESTDKVTLHIDRLPPSKPKIVFDKGMVTIEGEGAVYYELSETGSLPDIPTSSSQRYLKPLALPGKEDQLVTYFLSAIAADEYNNTSAIKGPSAFNVDNRTPTLPALRGIEDGQRFNSDTVSLKVENTTPDLQIFYTITTDGTRPNDPDFTSQQADKKIIFNGIENQEIHYRMKLLPAFVERNRTGKIGELSFFIDQKHPIIPTIEGFETGKTYNHNITVTLSDSHENETIYYSIADNSEQLTSPFSPTGRVFTGALNLDVDKNQEKSFFLRFGSEDLAGNRILSESVYQLTIDKKPPTDAEIMGIPHNGITNQPVTISLESENNIIHYSILEKQIVPAEEENSVSVFNGPFTVSGEAGKEKTYYLRVYTEDMAGNKSTQPVVKRFTIDRQIPTSPPEPIFTKINDKTETVIISWPTLPDDEIFYRIRKGSKFSASHFQKFTKPMEIKIPSDQLVIDYYREDWAGNRTGIYSKTETFLILDSEPTISGIRNNGLYKDSVRIYNTTEKGIVRFEARQSFNGTKGEVLEVNRFSPILPDTYTFPAIAGEENVYTLVVKHYRDEYDFIGNSTKTYIFTIDKQIPPPPKISGIQDGNFYRDDQTITLSTEEEKTFYCLEKKTESGSLSSNTPFLRYTQPIKIQTEPGTHTSWSFKAYTVDKAGNKSRISEPISFYIDKEIIYVSREIGNDYYEGTRTHPYQTLYRALEEAEESGRTTIMLDSQRYTLDAPLSVTTTLTLKGGYEPKSWKLAYKKKSVIEPGLYFPKNNPLIICDGGTLRMENVALEDPGQDTAVLLSVKEGELFLDSFTIKPAGTYKSIPFKQKGGSVTISNSMFAMANGNYPCFLESSGGTISIQNSEFSFGSKRKNFSLITIKDGLGSITNSILRGEKADTIINCEVINSDVIFEKTTIEIGRGETRAIGIHSLGGRLDITESTITGNMASRIVFGIQTEKSEVKIFDSKIDVDADRGTTALQTTDSIIDMQKSTIMSRGTAEYIYLLRCIDTEGDFFNNHFIIGETWDVLGFEFDSGKINFFNNTCIFPQKNNLLYGIRYSNCSNSHLINNILITRGSDAGSAIISEECENQMIAANNIYGWSNTLIKDGKIIKDAEELNMHDAQPFGGIYRKNISEEYNKTFIQDTNQNFHLRETSRCVDGGINVVPFGGPSSDREGDPRPNPNHGIRPAFDIGSNEY